jgi:hypothetical protein
MPISDCRGLLRRMARLLPAVLFVFPIMTSGAPVFMDDFAAGPSPLWGNQSGNWIAPSGAYYASSPNPAPSGTTLLPLLLTDFVLDVDINGASDGGVWLRANASRSEGVLLVVGGMGHSGGGVYWHIGPNYSDILNPSGPLFFQGDDLHIQVVVSGDTYTAYVNGSATPATTLITSSVASGLVGLYDFTGQTYGQQSFDNFVVSTAIPEPATPFLALAGFALLLFKRRLSRGVNAGGGKTASKEAGPCFGR